MKNTQNIWQQLADRYKPFFVLAPMDDVTDTVFRQIVQQTAAADLMMTEFANADGYCSPGKEAISTRLRFESTEQPLIAQIWGVKPENYRTMAADLAKMGFVGIDINMGCPVKDVVKKGACSAMIQNHELAAAVIEATKAGIADANSTIPVSVKTRIGFSEPDVEGWIGFLLEQKIDAITVHGRTRRQMSKVPADWAEIAKAVKLRDAISPNTVIIGNGDVLSRSEGVERAKKSGVDGIMIGRGIFHDPFVFSPEQHEPTLEEMLGILRRHVVLHQATWQEARFEPLKKFVKMYINGFAGAAEIRNAMMQTNNHQELLVNIDKLLKNG